MYEGFVSHSVILRYFVRPCVRYVHWGLCIAVNLKGGTTHIYSFHCSFSCNTAMGCVGFRLLFGTTIVL